MDYKSAIDFAEGYGLTTKSMKWFWDQYLPENMRWKVGNKTTKLRNQETQKPRSQ